MLQEIEDNGDDDDVDAGKYTKELGWRQNDQDTKADETNIEMIDISRVDTIQPLSEDYIRDLR